MVDENWIFLSSLQEGVVFLRGKLWLGESTQKGKRRVGSVERRRGMNAEEGLKITFILQIDLIS